jgi:polyisoprenoid-binding protein YceI
MNIRSQLALFSVLALGFAGAVSAAPETYTIDPVHSSVGFTIRHFVSKVPGSFTKFSGTIKYDAANPAASSVDATIEAGSVSTANEKRDTHVKSPDFLDAEKFTTITFKSTQWTKTGEDSFDIAGDLTLHGVTKPVVLKAKLLGVGPGMQGATLSGWEATTTIKKSDFGVAGPAMLAKALGDEVTVNIGIEAGYAAKK